MVDFLPALTAASNKYHLDSKLVIAQIRVESGDNPWAWNPEPRYRYFWNVRTHAPFRSITPLEIAAEFPPKEFPGVAGDPDQEWWGQQASWGLMQVMGALARERGFRGPYLTALCDPEINLEIGCAHLAGLLSWSHNNVDQALAAYNGGRSGNVARPFRNQAYADKIQSVYAAL